MLSETKIIESMDRGIMTFDRNDVPNPYIKLHARIEFDTREVVPAHYYIYKFHKLPPSDLLVDPETKDDKGYTCEMYWLEYCRNEPPAHLRHKPDIVNKDNSTCADLWKKHNNTKPPPFLLE